MGFFDYLGAIIIVGAVILAAYYVTRLVAGTGGGAARKGAHMKLRGALPLARDRSVALVEVGGFVYVLGVSAHHVERLDRLELDAFNLKQEEGDPPAAGLGPGFQKELNERLRRWSGHG